MTPQKQVETLGKKRIHDRSRAMAEAVVSAFSQVLKEEANKHGGFLGLRHLEEIDGVFQTKLEELSEVFEKALQESKREQENLKWHAIKRPAFDRLMVRHFESLFLYVGGDELVYGDISRRVLPGFFLALNMMLGPEALKRYQNHCDEALDRVMAGKLPIDWDLVEKDANVHNVLLDAQYTIAHYFDDPQQRAAWFINIINANLAPAQAGAFDEEWVLDTAGLFKMIECLLLDLKTAVDDDVAWTHLAVRHEGSDRSKLLTIFKNI